MLRLNKLIDSLDLLVRELWAGRKQREKEFEWMKAHCGLVTKQDLQEMEQRIMSKISDFAEKQTAFNTRLNTAVEGLIGDVESLNAKIKELQENPGPISPEDQALLNALETEGEALATKLEKLDSDTPPTLPPA